MAKRFTDTNKWLKESFGTLSLKMKLVWVYLCDNCDHAGIWDANFRLLAFHLGETISREEMDESFGDKICWLGSTKLFIPSFVEFQYSCSLNGLNPENKVHLSVINSLKKYGAIKGLARSIQGSKDKDKEKDKENVLGESEGKITSKDLAEVYKTYPLKKGKAKGLAKAKTEIKTFHDLADLKTAIGNYRAQLEREKTDKEFIKHFSTFMGEWRDFLDADSGSSDIAGTNAMPDLSHVKWDEPGGAA